MRHRLQVDDVGLSSGAWVLVNDTIAICPPLIITEPQIDELFDALGRALDDALGAFEIKG